MKIGSVRIYGSPASIAIAVLLSLLLPWTHSAGQAQGWVKTLPLMRKIRLLVHDTTWGGGATEAVVKAGGQTGPHHIMLREVEICST